MLYRRAAEGNVGLHGALGFSGAPVGCCCCVLLLGVTIVRFCVIPLCLVWCKVLLRWSCQLPAVLRLAVRWVLVTF